MVTTEQKKAIAEAEKKLQEARKTLGGEAEAITRRIGGGGSRVTSRQDQINDVLARFRSGEISQQDASSQVRRIQRGGGFGAGADPIAFQRATSAIQTFEEQRGMQTIEGQIKEVPIFRIKTIASQLQEEALGFRIGLSEQERRRTTGEIIRGRFAEVGSGLVSAGALLIEGGIGLAGALGQQFIEFDEEGKRIDRSFRFSEEGLIGRQRAKPSGTGKVLGQALVFAPLVGGAIAGFGVGVSAQGFKTTVVETVTAFSPLKIPTQTFGALVGGKGVIDSLKFDVVSFKTTTGDVTKRLVVGKARDFDDVFLFSKQISTKVGGKDVSFAVTDITAPTTTFRLGKFTSGLQSVRTESIAGALGGGKVSKVKVFGDILKVSQIVEGVTGGAGRVATRTRVSLFIDETGRFTADVNLGVLDFGFSKTTGAVSTGLGDDVLKVFQAGRGRRILQIGKEGIGRKVRIDDFNIRGVEFDIGKIGALDTGVSVTTPTGKGITGFTGKDTGLQTFAKQISASISDIVPVVSAKNGASAISQVVKTTGVFGLPSVFAGTGQFERTDFAGSLKFGGVQTFGRGQQLISPSAQKDLLKIVDVPLVDLGVDILGDLDIGQRGRVTPKRRLRGRQRFDQPPRLDFRTAVDLAVGTDVIQEPIQKLRQEPRQELQPRQRPRPSGDPFFDIFGSTIPPVVPGFLLPPLIFPTFRGGRRRQRGRRPRERIAPSLTGQVLFDLGDITGGPLKISGALGRSPADIRFVPKSLVGTRRQDFSFGGFLGSKPKRKKKK